MTKTIIRKFMKVEKQTDYLENQLQNVFFLFCKLLSRAVSCSSTGRILKCLRISRYIVVHFLDSSKTVQRLTPSCTF